MGLDGLVLKTGGMKTGGWVGVGFNKKFVHFFKLTECFLAVGGTGWVGLETDGMRFWIVDFSVVL